MNKNFEVLVYTHAEDIDGAYGETDIVKGFDTFEEAEKYYSNVRYYFGKQLMKYASLDPYADGEVMQEDHHDEDLSERSFTVTKIDVLATCEVNLSEEDLIELNGLSQEQINEKIQENAIDSDMWRHVESEDNVSYEVDES